MRRATRDTNIYVSALHFRGAAAQVLHMAVDGDLEIAISDSIVKKSCVSYRKNSDGSRMTCLTPGSGYAGLPELSSRRKRSMSSPHDEPDNRILECARAAGSDVIVTEDKDLLRLKEFEGIPILRLAEFLAQDLTLDQDS